MPKYLIDSATQAISAQIDADAARQSGALINILGSSADADKVISIAADSELEKVYPLFGTPAGASLFTRLRPYTTEVLDGSSGAAPVHYWPLEEASGPLVSPGSGAAGSLGSGGTYRAGGSSGGPLADTPSYAISVDGTANGWALQTTTGTLDTLASTAATFECWVYVATPTAGVLNLFSYGNVAPGGVAGNNTHIGLRMNATGNVVGQLLYNNTALRASTHSTVLTANTWYHVVLSHHPTNGTVTYVNGVAGPNQTGSVASMPALSSLSGGSRLMIGAPWSNTAPASGGFTGRIAHAGFYYGYAMSQAQAQLHYMIGKKGTA